MKPSVMTKRLGLLLLAGMTQTAAAALPGSYDTVQRNGRVLAQVAEDLPPGKVSATLVCLDGLQFALGAMIGLGGSVNPTVSIVQVYSAQDGQVRPASCSSR
ncbi:MAG: hypothetical protein RLZ44_1570 [Pseudomonadota bacterium]